MLNRILFVLLALAGMTCAARAQEAQVTAFPAAYSLIQSDVEAAAAQALVAQNAGARIHAMLMGNRSTVLYQSAKPLSLKLTGFTFDRSTSRWTASMLITSGDEVVTAMPVGGRYEEVVLRPVLKRQVRSGETIAESDIEIMEFPISHTRNDEITDERALLGLGPRTAISPHRPIRAAEVAPPALVHKNAIVTMRFDSGSMEITTSGQAMTDGSKGEMVEVKNLASKNVVRAIVEDANTVSVGPAKSNRELAGVPYVPAN